METIREQIVQRIVALLSGISTENGYNNNVPGTIFRNRDVLDDIDFGESAVGVNEDEETRQATYSQQIRTLPISIIFAKYVDNSEIPVEASRIAGDLEKFTTLIESDTEIKELIRSVSVRSISVSAAAARTQIAACQITYDVVFATKRGDPYTVIV